MTNREAIGIFNKWTDCKDAYQADPSCDGNCSSCEYYASAEEGKEAMQMAISALKKQEQYCDTCKHGYFGDAWCERCAVRFASHYEAEEEA